jgi:hypothetical protein
MLDDMELPGMYFPGDTLAGAVMGSGIAFLSANLSGVA